MGGLIGKVLKSLPSSWIISLYKSRFRAILLKTYEFVNKDNTTTKPYRIKAGVLLSLCEGVPGERAIVYNVYENEITNLFLTVLREGDIVFDVGSWIGYYAVIAARKARKVVALDINEGNLTRVRENAELNHFHNIETLRVGVDNKSGSGCVVLNEGPAMSRLIDIRIIW